jgi:hypothetical protein
MRRLAMRAPPMKPPTAAPAIGPAFDGVVPPVELGLVDEQEYWDVKVCVFVEELVGEVVVVAVGCPTREIVMEGFGATCSTVVPGLPVRVVFVSTMADTPVLS